MVKKILRVRKEKAGKPLVFGAMLVLACLSVSWGTNFPAAGETTNISPQLIFHASFDKSADADLAMGDGSAIHSGVELGPGKIGQAIRPQKDGFIGFKYSMDKNFNMERGGLSFWYYLEESLQEGQGAILFRTDQSYGCEGYMDVNIVRTSDKAVYLVFTIITEPSKGKEKYKKAKVISHFNNVPGWHHIAVNWDCEIGLECFYNGHSRGLGKANWRAGKPPGFFCILQQRGSNSVSPGWMDDLRIYNMPISQQQDRGYIRTYDSAEKVGGDG